MGTPLPHGDYCFDPEHDCVHDGQCPFANATHEMATCHNFKCKAPLRANCSAVTESASCQASPGICYWYNDKCHGHPECVYDNDCASDRPRCTDNRCLAAMRCVESKDC